MSATTAPKPGVDYKVVLGDSLLEPPTNAANTYAILRYDFKPASVDRSRQGMVQVQQNKKQVMHSLPTINVAEPEIHYQGRFDAGNELDCVAIFDGKGGFRLERVLGQAYLRHTTKRTMKREPKSQGPQQHVNGSSPLVESAHTGADRKLPCRPEQAARDADAEAFDAELEAELERGLFEDADEQDEPVTMSALPPPAPSSAPSSAPPSAPPSADIPKQVPSIATTSAPQLTANPIPDNIAVAEHSSSSESSDSSDSDDEASPKAGSPKAAVPPWTAAPEKAEPMNELEREFLGIPAPAAPAVQEPKPAEPHQSSDSSSDSSSSDSSSSDSSSSDSSDDEDIHKCSDDESEGKDIEWF